MNWTMHDEFTRSICKDPQDDTPRLIFSDWLEEQGQEDRAEFIRVQIELSKRDIHNCNQGLCNTAGYGPCFYCKVTEYLEQKEEELFLKLFPQFLNHKKYFNLGKMEKAFTCGECFCHAGFVARYERGFPATLRCRQHDIIQCGRDIFRYCPIQKVTLEDKTPRLIVVPAVLSQCSGWLWHSREEWIGPLPADTHCLARVIWNELDPAPENQIENNDSTLRYDTREEAEEKLSDACIRWGRKQAGFQ